MHTYTCKLTYLTPPALIKSFHIQTVHQYSFLPYNQSSNFSFFSWSVSLYNSILLTVFPRLNASVSRVPDVGEAQAIVRCSDEAAGCGCGRNNFEGGNCEAVRCRFNAVYMARALAERNKRRPRINAAPV